MYLPLGQRHANRNMRLDTRQVTSAASAGHHINPYANMLPETKAAVRH